MQPDAAANYGGLIAALVAFLVFAFLVFALRRAQQRKRQALDALERREIGTPPEDLQKRDETNQALEAKGEAAPVPAPEVEPEGEPPAPELVPTKAPPEPRVAAEPMDERLAEGLKRTKEGLFSRLGGLFVAKEIPADLLQQVEAILLTSDLGVKTTNRLLESVKDQLSKKELRDQQTLIRAIEGEVRSVLAQAHQGEWHLPEVKPAVILMVGVNGVGKTTTIGKLAAKFSAEGKKVLVAAGDTFRAAAADQLKIWAERAGAEYYAGAAGKDPASVIFEACEKAKVLGVDIVLADTAGRLHTKTNLMDELKKVKRVVGKVIEGAPHEVFLVVDGTTGQNAVSQAREFHEALGLTGIVLTKLDGTAKGGVIVAIAAELNVPMRFVGVGETADDLRRFDPKTFAKALFGT
ncbi:MAG: signal recognition particle-docking protein FtsY [Deltaproteobacteria bacterium]|nr:signal recognition particle-docking protein FtsY [Deltaproteobacteria bacterium]